MNYEIFINKFQEFHCIVVSLFPDSRVGLVLFMVCSSPAIKQVYNCTANDMGPV